MITARVLKQLFFNCLNYLIKVIHEHLSHFINGNGCIDGTVQTQLSNSIGEGAKMERVGMRQQDRIDLVNMPRTQARWLLLSLVPKGTGRILKINLPVLIPLSILSWRLWWGKRAKVKWNLSVMSDSLRPHAQLRAKITLPMNFN